MERKESFNRKVCSFKVPTSHRLSESNVGKSNESPKTLHHALKQQLTLHLNSQIKDMIKSDFDEESFHSKTMEIQKKHEKHVSNKNEKGMFKPRPNLYLIKCVNEIKMKKQHILDRFLNRS